MVRGGAAGERGGEREGEGLGGFARFGRVGDVEMEGRFGARDGVGGRWWRLFGRRVRWWALCLGVENGGGGGGGGEARLKSGGGGGDPTSRYDNYPDENDGEEEVGGARSWHSRGKLATSPAVHGRSRCHRHRHSRRPRGFTVHKPQDDV